MENPDEESVIKKKTTMQGEGRYEGECRVNDEGSERERERDRDDLET